MAPSSREQDRARAGRRFIRHGFMVGNAIFPHPGFSGNAIAAMPLNPAPDRDVKLIS
jgi:hypothetical protein